MKRLLCAILLVGLLILPGLGLTEGDDTIRLAKTLYTLGKGESYETLLDLGTVVMNRVDSPWYPDTVYGVLTQPHQFACGTLYDELAYRAAREVMMGKRTLPPDALLYAALDASAQPDAETLVARSGGYGFYSAR